jgi:glutamate synthase (NADPH) small chain
MLKFVTVAQGDAREAPAQPARAGFPRDLSRVRDQKAAEQAGRCSQCGVPYCQSHCPLHNNIPDWLR